MRHPVLLLAPPKFFTFRHHWHLFWSLCILKSCPPKFVRKREEEGDWLLYLLYLIRIFHKSAIDEHAFWNNAASTNCRKERTWGRDLFCHCLSTRLTDAGPHDICNPARGNSTGSPIQPEFWDSALWTAWWRECDQHWGKWLDTPKFGDVGAYNGPWEFWKNNTMPSKCGRKPHEVGRRRRSSPRQGTRQTFWGELQCQAVARKGFDLPGLTVGWLCLSKQLGDTCVMNGLTAYRVREQGGFLCRKSRRCPRHKSNGPYPDAVGSLLRGRLIVFVTMLI